MFGIMWLLLIRPAQKRQKQTKAMQDALQRGDEIVTIAGMHGTIDAIEDTAVHVKIADNVIIKLEKQAIGTVVGK